MSSPPGFRAWGKIYREGESLWIPAQALRDLALEEVLHGFGGWVRSPTDPSGSTWVKRPHRPLDKVFKTGRIEPGIAIAMLLSLAKRLEFAERTDRFAGPLSPDQVGVVDGDIVLFAEPYLAARVGAVVDVKLPSTPYCPPAQASGEPFDHAANRLVFGLIAYRLLTGVHAFAGLGLRRALEVFETEGAPAFPVDPERELPMGAQALVLQILSPDPAARPTSARAIVEGLAVMAAGGSPSLLSTAAEPRSRRAEPSRSPERTASDSKSSVATAAPRPPAKPAGNAAPKRALTLGLALSLLAASAVALFKASSRDEPVERGEKPNIRPYQPLSADLGNGSCASCHPSQSAQWQRSVMGHSAKSPLYNALEALIEEQFGRDSNCPNGAGALRKVDPRVGCRNPQTGLMLTGTGGEHWCVNCHAPNEVLDSAMPAWNALGDARTRHPVRDLLSKEGLEGIGCLSCHRTHGPVVPGRTAYQGNPTWASPLTGQTFGTRPEDRNQNFGIGNSGFDIDRRELFGVQNTSASQPHGQHTAETKRYLRSSEFCGSCHDVRLFGTDAVVQGRGGEHFKRLRNAYSEWVAYGEQASRTREPSYSCQDCHMSTFPGVCVTDEDAERTSNCPKGMRFEPRKPGSYERGTIALSTEPETTLSHYFTAVDLPLARELSEDELDETSVDASGTPLSPRARRDALLRAAFRFEVGRPTLAGGLLSIPIEIENIGAGHRIPAGFSQEREFWVHLTVKSPDGRTVYEVGRTERDDEDLRDKRFVRVNTNPNIVDAQGRPVGLFGADVADGPDRPEWTPPPESGATAFRGKGLINFQNGFLRCVTCVGTIAADGSCLALPGQTAFRAQRFEDGEYDLDTGACRSNLDAKHALFETYFPVGALDASRGLPKAADAIIDTRSAPPKTPLRYTYEIPGVTGPVDIEARLMFRAFPPFLVRAFAEYEAQMAARGQRPSGPLVVPQMLKRLERVTLVSIKTSASQ